jgi:hypothetical protein
MKRYLITLAVTLFLLNGCSKESDRSDQNKDAYSRYGEDIQGAGAVTIEEMYAQLHQDGSFEGKVKGEITEVCVQKGCWMTLKLPDGKHMRVTFKDYGFFVPKDSQGNEVIISGKADYSITDVHTLRHYAEDAGKTQEEIDAIVEDEESITFVAEGVLIKE